MKKINGDFILAKVLDFFSYIISGTFPEKLFPQDLSSNEIIKNEKLAEPPIFVRVIKKENLNTRKKAHLTATTLAQTFSLSSVTKDPKEILGARSRIPRLERKSLNSPRKIRSRYTNIQRNKLLLPESSALNPDQVCHYLCEARISELLNIPGFTPDLVARIYDARREKKFTSVKEIEERVPGFMGSHLSELQVFMSHSKQ